MTNAPIILTLDCDMYSNDPSTPQRALCCFLDQTLWPELAFVQFPQCFRGLNEADIYASEIKDLFHTNSMGMDGLRGPNYVGTGCFFRRRALFGCPSSFEKAEIQELYPDHVANKPIRADEILQQAHYVASCNYEDESNWGSKMGFRYGSLVEDYYTGYRLQCEGWKSIFCYPKRPAFLGDIPISLYEVVSQNKRWSVGLLEVAFSKYSPITFGVRSMGFLMAHCNAHYAFWPI
ncbi:Cellulose synthase-like protein G3 [Capsicum chinense]|nr:Cellulose synthase-like protein G3 [Capsicum chinense]